MRIANLVRVLIMGIEIVCDSMKPKYAINRTILVRNFHKQLILRMYLQRKVMKHPYNSNYYLVTYREAETVTEADGRLIVAVSPGLFIALSVPRRVPVCRTSHTLELALRLPTLM